MRNKIAITAAMVFFVLCAFIIDARAQTIPPPPISWERVSLVAGAGVNQWDSSTGAALGQVSDMQLIGGITYSTGRMIQLVATETYLTSSSVGMFEPGIRSVIVGDGSGQYSQLALGAGGVYYHGANADLIGGPMWKWNAGIYGSYNVAGKVNKPLRWYISGAAIVDPNEEGSLSSKTRYRLDLRAVGIPHLFQ